ncbi:RagB/SusD family nutrient uptake outer membrane protein [Tamlana fucoidanivorans]|uniref:RagB/SusD family nutrient uptake outer membrane protein n=1 Tax=Allotamlana fucoidanivorans TaxID=2583814 RepID=A0A5C4SRT7_9FLAO|nr:RagB/SusD family nutrient uptake outer membrane protein [Tamlana fucoidanivorans]
MTCFSCEEFVEVDPPNSRVVSAVVYQSENLATAAVDGIYHRLFNFSGFASGSVNSITVLTGVSSDELDLYNTLAFPEYPFFYDNTIAPDSSINLSIWSSAYNIIYHCNTVLEGLAASHAISETLKQQLKGEVIAIRAFTYFNLVNLYGGVPLILSTDYTTNALASRDSKEKCYQKIIVDLETAVDLLAPEYRDGIRSHLNRYAATALLARVYLYQEDWSLVEEKVSEVINTSSQYTILNNLDDVFLANSEEAIWQLAPVGTTGHTNDGAAFIIRSVNYFLNPVALSDGLITAFESGDHRFEHWITTVGEGSNLAYYAYKYKIRFTIDPPSEYSTVFRLAELYLIRAEARVQLGDLSGAQDDINVIRGRAGLSFTNANTSKDLLDAVRKERRIELFTEQGHRWFDLIRTGKASDILSVKHGSWSETNEKYPIPEQELAKNPNLTQNEGY